MKNKMILLLCGAAVLLCGTACSGSSSQPDTGSVSQSASGSDEMQVHAADGVDAAYTEIVRTYFEAIEKEDFAAYQSVLYPPFKEAYAAFLQKQDNGDTPESMFHALCHRFDEDGYTGWHLTELNLEYLQENKTDFDGFFDAYISAGYFDDSFAEDCKNDAKDMKDISFSLYALYDGDAEPVQIVSGSEIIVLKTDSGAYLFG